MEIIFSNFYSKEFIFEYIKNISNRCVPEVRYSSITA